MLQIGLNFVPGIVCGVVVLDDKDRYPEVLREAVTAITLNSGGAMATITSAETTAPLADYFVQEGNEGNPLNHVFHCEDRTPLIVIHESLLRGLSDEELVGILHHENAHHELGHMAKFAATAERTGELQVSENNTWELEADAAGAKATSKAVMTSAMKKVVEISINLAFEKGYVTADQREEIFVKAMANEAMVERMAALAV